VCGVGGGGGLERARTHIHSQLTNMCNEL
jgi:hypothetical protein